jgi:hypothetical protein
MTSFARRGQRPYGKIKVAYYANAGQSQLARVVSLAHQM